ncbi:MAG: sulfite exporter TauE/SafE family protein [Pseudomonadota bacterium]
MNIFALIFGDLGPFSVGLAVVIGVVAGIVKGVVGFAMPMILVSGLSSIMAPELALATLILPTLATNGLQALRQGWRAALVSIRQYWVFLVVGGTALVVAAQFVRVLPQSLFFLIIGVPVVGFALLQLSRRGISLPSASRRVEAMVALVAGTMGGLSGVWGPPTAAYLTATNTPKAEQMRVQGVIYGLGSLALVLAHVQSGVLRTETLPLSAFMVVPALVGMAIGTAIQDRIDQVMFRRATLSVLLVVGLNLIRRGLT